MEQTRNIRELTRKGEEMRGIAWKGQGNEAKYMGMNQEYTRKTSGLENREKLGKYALDIPIQGGLESDQVKGNESIGPLD